MDDGESTAQAAVRELKEETGFSGAAGRASSVCYSDPGTTNANMQVGGTCQRARRCAGLVGTLEDRNAPA